MKYRIRSIFSFLCICLVTVILLSTVANVVKRKDSQSKNAIFFEEKDQVDVLFFGSSHMLNAAHPMELWETYGITSYSFAGHGSRLPTTYWIMRNALDYAKPKVVVIDCYYLSADVKTDEQSEFVHLSLDAFPVTTTKVQTVFDLFEDQTQRAAYLFPFSTYHNRWKELVSSDFLVTDSPEKGAGIRIGNMGMVEPTYISPEDKLIGDTQGISYLRKMIEYCQGQGIEVVLTYMPFAAAEWAQREANTVAEIAEEYKVCYAGFRELCEQINFATDFSDATHLNYSGGAKITNYIGGLIQENYDIEDRRTDPKYENWFEDAEQYKSYKAELMKQQTSAAMFFPMLADNNLTTILLYNGQWEYAAADAMLMDLGVPEQILAGNRTFVAVIDNQNDTCSVLHEGDMLDTRYGRMALENTSGSYMVTINGEVVYTLPQDQDIGMWVRSLDADTGNTVYETAFNKKGYH